MGSRNMKTGICRVSKIKPDIYMVCLLICVLSHPGICSNTNSLTFFGWSDQQVNTEHLKVNEWAEIDADLLPYIKAGLKEAIEKEYLKSSNPCDYAVTGMNMGWELPGTLDASIQIRDFEVLAGSSKIAY